mmetsp:Transcript_1426/g.2018  ORF Transcript_1426/g.2018 Transcript_1426/m.2018 type:complete len:295 (+) Transcript_1426:33-917(+)
MTTRLILVRRIQRLAQRIRILGARDVIKISKEKCALIMFIIIFLLVITEALTGSTETSKRPSTASNSLAQVKFEVRHRNNHTVRPRCLNTKGGRNYVADSTGAVCKRTDLAEDGCCKLSPDDSRFSCDTCHSELKCCRSYEYCVSCCLRGEANNSTKFNECSRRCRVNSRMILHGNQYRHAFKYCHWKSVEPTLPMIKTNPTLYSSSKRVDCRDTCLNYGKICHEDFFGIANDCDVVKRELGCSECTVVKNPTAPSLQNGKCLINENPKHFDCEARGETIKRLCVCIQPGEVYT